ncbi:N-acetyltransferase [candidate division KSB1 bacterium]|nr:N-acetyltransferase [candidate division KSB1 bacterium]
MDIIIEKMTDNDWQSVARIYREGIATQNATFETSVPVWELWDKSHLRECRLVARIDGLMTGWAALSPVSDRCVYGGVAEVSIYVTDHQRGKGIGKILLNRLIKESEEYGIWTLQAGIFPENSASIKLHISCGFRIVGIREKIGKINGIWRDVMLLERRSNITGYL